MTNIEKLLAKLQTYSGKPNGEPETINGLVHGNITQVNLRDCGEGFIDNVGVYLLTKADHVTKTQTGDIVTYTAYDINWLKV